MIQRSLLYLGAVFYLLNGVRMIANPQVFFDGTAGVSATGGYNVHFIVDIGFAFLVSAGAMAAGVWLRRRSLILAGLAWPVLHAAFHTAGLAMHGAVSRAAWMVETGGVILPALLLAALALRVPLSGLGAGMPRLVHAGLRRFEAQWFYDAAYLHRLVDTVPDSMRFLTALQGLSALSSRQAPPALLHGASLAASLHEDCGPCAQITIDKICADGADPETVRALIRQDFERADPVSALGFSYAAAVLAGQAEALAMRDEIVQRYGQTALSELALAVVVSRTYPTIKQLTGFGAACQTLDVAGQTETVAAA